ncbi:interleukin-1 receptor-associated kinase 1-binding protein 1 homolog [Fundulus heteroclitus]|uniref:interleukin-1 receptor-associated kinase 1-binding protein 1 homolog n=1 Tax=Fundulus heteroclitus TaxID=8078 RepID=UPI00165BB4BF|nr:interleukin-1 receptor-associated kinase 1-binding protein 1 homolog [Fundulus heteroclitus]
MNTTNSAVRLFAALPSAEPGGRDKQQGLEGTALPRERLGTPAREVQVTGAAEVSCRADRASVRISVTSTKGSVNDVTNSISRRLEYILQTIRQHGVGDEHTSVRRFLHRDVDAFSMEAEVVVTFSEFEKMEQMCSFLLDKLDKSVHVGAPQFFHSDTRLHQLRLQACLSAVENAQQKASKISQLLGESLGSPLLVREEETKEWRNEEEAAGREHGSLPRLPFIPHVPTASASSQVSITFSFRDKSKKRL